MNKKIVLPILLIVQFILVRIMALFPEWIEKYYSNELYLKIASVLRLSLGKIPFSVGDIMYTATVMYILFWFVISVKKKYYKATLLSVLSFLSVLYFIFHLFWGLNYYRQPLFEKMNLEKKYTDNELINYTEKLIAKTNAIQLEITKNKAKKVIIQQEENEIFNQSIIGYQKIEQLDISFKYEKTSVKKSLISLPLSYMGFGGYLNPFTNEAQVNYLMPQYSLPITTTHEMAHQLGFASESECNFIGFMAAINNPNPYYKYSGYCLALRYCMSNVKAKNEVVFKKLKSQINPGIIANFKESEIFWEKYESPIEKAFKWLYDNYLKANQQDEGIESYSKFIDLMINYYKTNELK
jgi:hypothetical protein